MINVVLNKIKSTPLKILIPVVLLTIIALVLLVPLIIFLVRSFTKPQSPLPPIKQFTLSPTPSALQPRLTPVVTKDDLPAKIPGFGINPTSKLRYTGKIIDNPEKLFIYADKNPLVLTKDMALLLAQKLDFTSQPKEQKNNKNNTILEWQNTYYHLIIELGDGLLMLNKLLEAPAKTTQPISDNQALKEVSVIISTLEDQPVEINESNSKVTHNPNSPNIISIEVKESFGGIPVVASSTRWLNNIHFDKEKGLVESLQYSLTSTPDRVREESLISFTDVVKPEGLRNGEILRLTQPNAESIPSPTGEYTLTSANFSAAQLVYLTDRDKKQNRKYIPAYLFEGEAEIAEFVNQVFEVQYFIPAVNI